jgi:hypothetical protein
VVPRQGKGADHCGDNGDAQEGQVYGRRPSSPNLESKQYRLARIKTGERCPHCDQPLPQTRVGVRLPDLKARIFDLVARAGAAGISGEDLFAIAYNDDAPIGKGIRLQRSRKTLKSHVGQINELIEDSGYRIFCSGRNPTSTYRLARVGGAP